MLTKAETARLRSLRDKKEREATGLFVVEGEKVVRELVAAKFPFAEFYVTEASSLREQPGARLISESEMERISHFPTASSCFAVGQLQRLMLEDGQIDQGLTLALDGVQDAGNVGTLIRVADWFGFSRILLSPDSADLFSQKVINASMGSFARMRVHTLPLAPVLTSARVPVWGCDLSGTDVHDMPAARDAVVVIGSEGRGLSPEVRACIRKLVTIPRIGGAESLNAAVAAAIVCDNLVRRNRSG